MQSPSLPFLGEILGRLRGEEGRWLVGLEEASLFGPKGYAPVFIVPLIPDTSGIRGLAQIIPKNVFSLPIPFSVISQSKKVYNLDPNRVSSLFLSNAIKKIFSFPNIWHIQDFAYLREIE